jgi:hypothetical protein
MLPRLAVPLRLASALLLAGPGSAATLLAQEAERTPAPAAQRAPAKPVAEVKPGEAPAPARRGQLANVRVDVKITDTHSGQPPTMKTVSVTVADRRQGMVRSTIELLAKDAAPRHVPLHVDVRPEIDGGKVRLELTLDYSIPPLQPGVGASTHIKESLGLVLDSGKPLVVSESAEPIGDRRVKLEITATIL